MPNETETPRQIDFSTRLEDGIRSGAIPPPGLLREKLENAIKDGDLRTMVACLSKPGAASSAMGAGNKIYDAITQISEHGCDELVDRVLQLSIEFNSELLMRAMVRAQMKIDSLAGAESGPELKGVPRDAEPDLDRIARIQDRIVVLSRARGTAKHVSSIVRRNGSENVVPIGTARADKRKAGGP
jgi:hypothetical protein